MKCVSFEKLKRFILYSVCFTYYIRVRCLTLNCAMAHCVLTIIIMLYFIIFCRLPETSLRSELILNGLWVCVYIPNSFLYSKNNSFFFLFRPLLHRHNNNNNNISINLRHFLRDRSHDMVHT